MMKNRDDNRFLCGRCHNAMEIITVNKYEDAGKWSALIVGGGLFSLLFLGGLLFGVPIMAAGLYVGTAKRILSYCPDCGNQFELMKKEKYPD